MICEGCIKQDTCKFRGTEGDVERFERIMEGFPMEALEVTCKYKQVGPCDTTTISWPYPLDTTTWTNAITYTS